MHVRDCSLRGSLHSGTRESCCIKITVNNAFSERIGLGCDLQQLIFLRLLMAVDTDRQMRRTEYLRNSFLFSSRLALCSQLAVEGFCEFYLLKICLRHLLWKLAGNQVTIGRPSMSERASFSFVLLFHLPLEETLVACFRGLRTELIIQSSGTHDCVACASLLIRRLQIRQTRFTVKELTLIPGWGVGFRFLSENRIVPCDISCRTGIPWLVEHRYDLTGFRFVKLAGIDNLSRKVVPVCVCQLLLVDRQTRKFGPVIV